MTPPNRWTRPLHSLANALRCLGWTRNKEAQAAMSARKLFYLGPQGTFTHQAAVNAAQELARLEPQGFDLMPMDDVPQILDAAQHGDGWGIVAWENNVEGYVVPNLDALIDAKDLVGFARVGVNVEFDAFGPAICGELYDITRIGTAIQDYQGAATDFLVLAPRAEVARLLAKPRAEANVEYESVLTLIPLVTGPGVLANLLDVFRDAGLNMTSFISRPIKGRTGTYSFIVTLDAAPWEERFRDALVEIAEHGDWAKTLAVYPRRERPNPPVTSWMLPQGGVRLDDSHLPDDWQNDETVRRELMW